MLPTCDADAHMTMTNDIVISILMVNIEQNQAKA